MGSAVEVKICCFLLIVFVLKWCFRDVHCLVTDAARRAWGAGSRRIIRVLQTQFSSLFLS